MALSGCVGPKDDGPDWQAFAREFPDNPYAPLHQDTFHDQQPGQAHSADLAELLEMRAAVQNGTADGATWDAYWSARVGLVEDRLQVLDFLREYLDEGGAQVAKTAKQVRVEEQSLRALSKHLEAQASRGPTKSPGADRVVCVVSPVGFIECTNERVLLQTAASGGWRQGVWVYDSVRHRSALALLDSIDLLDAAVEYDTEQGEGRAWCEGASAWLQLNADEPTTDLLSMGAADQVSQACAEAGGDASGGSSGTVTGSGGSGSRGSDHPASRKLGQLIETCDQQADSRGGLSEWTASDTSRVVGGVALIGLGLALVKTPLGAPLIASGITTIVITGADEVGEQVSEQTPEEAPTEDPEENPEEEPKESPEEEPKDDPGEGEGSDGSDDPKDGGPDEPGEPDPEEEGEQEDPDAPDEPGEPDRPSGGDGGASDPGVGGGNACDQMRLFKQLCDETDGWDQPGTPCHEMARAMEGCISMDDVTPNPDGPDDLCVTESERKQQEEEARKRACEAKRGIMDPAGVGDIPCDLPIDASSLWQPLNPCTDPRAQPTPDTDCSGNSPPPASPEPVPLPTGTGFAQPGRVILDPTGLGWFGMDLPAPTP